MIDTDSYFARRKHYVMPAVNLSAQYRDDIMTDWYLPGPPKDVPDAQSRLRVHRYMLDCTEALLHSGRVAPGGELFWSCVGLLERQHADVDHLRAWIAAQELGGGKEQA